MFVEFINIEKSKYCSISSHFLMFLSFLDEGNLHVHTNKDIHIYIIDLPYDDASYYGCPSLSYPLLPH